jgi:hypothetical protein
MTGKMLLCDEQVILVSSSSKFKLSQFKRFEDLPDAGKNEDIRYFFEHRDEYDLVDKDTWVKKKTSDISGPNDALFSFLKALSTPGCEISAVAIQIRRSDSFEVSSSDKIISLARSAGYMTMEGKFDERMRSWVITFRKG